VKRVYQGLTPMRSLAAELIVWRLRREECRQRTRGIYDGRDDEVFGTEVDGKVVSVLNLGTEACTKLPSA
jgi:hypothetical protein